MVSFTPIYFPIPNKDRPFSNESITTESSSKSSLQYEKTLPNASANRPSALKGRLYEILPAASLKKSPLKSSAKFLVASLVMAAAAAILFIPCFPLSMILSAISAWTLLTASLQAISYAFRKSDHSASVLLRRFHAIVLDVNGSIVSAALLILNRENKRPAPQLTKKSQGKPILLLHGYLGHSSNLWYQKKRLLKEGFGPIYSMNLGSFSSIANYAKEVGEIAREIKQNTRSNRLQLVCHSKGGLVGAYYAVHLAKEDNIHVTDLVAIGSPFSGTPAAKIGRGIDAEEMRPESSFHANLREEITKHPEIRLFCIGSEADFIVPKDSALSGTRDPKRQKAFKDLGHMSLILSRKTADQVCAWLKG